jgi:hypothetical protein
VRDPDVVLGQEGDLLVVHVDAVGGEDARPEQPALGEHAHAGLTGRRHEQLGGRRHRPRSVEEPVLFRPALRQMRRNGNA